MSYGDLESSSGLASISKRLHTYSTALEEVSLPSMDNRHSLEEQQKGASFRPMPKLSIGLLSPEG